ncbi:MAG TPA: hypothetical protein VNT79_12970 [Phycisphaerae bacterium]|nr:hypothetical protein [Phycisphaerae bacterium]
MTRVRFLSAALVFVLTHSGSAYAQEEVQPPENRDAIEQSRLVDELAAEHELLWQKAVATFKSTERDARMAVMKDDYAEAYRLLAYARSVIETNRRYATPAAEYEAYIQQSRDLEAYIQDSQRNYEERMIAQEREEVLRAEQDRAVQIQETRNRQVDQLMTRARELQKEWRLEEAIQTLDQVLAFDPQNDQAAYQKDLLGDVLQNHRDRVAKTDRGTWIQEVMISNSEAGIPYNKDISYPKNWPQIRARAGTEAEGESELTQEVRAKLQRPAPELNFDGKSFEDVVEQLRTATDLNIIPNWSALEALGIEKDFEVNLKLKNVRYDQALELILDEVAQGESELEFEIDEGIVRISTKEDLARRHLTVVYNIQDLLITVPTFRGRRPNLDQIGQNQQQGGIGGGRFIQGGGQGGQGGQQGGIFGGGGGQDQDDDDLEQADPMEPIIQLIQDTIDPESWREAGGVTGAISSLQQQLIVTQTSTAHTELRNLLTELRAARALQIAIEARYITVTRNWLEQIGVDLDVILNNGNAGFDRTTILDPATNNPVLVPRQFVRNGFTPGAPGGVGITLPTQPFGQPYGQPGLVPATGDFGPASSTFTPIPIVNNTLDLASPANTNVAGSLGSTGNASPAFQIFGSFLDNIQVDFLLRATQIDRRASDLDAPRLVLFNGQRSTFEVFVEQDYIAALTPVIGDNAGAFLPQIDSALTGRSLDVQATVSSDRRYVTMTVRTFTQVTGDFRTVFFGGSQTVGSGFVELATRTTQSIRTTVSVPDGGTLLIGGLKLSGERDIDAGVPILSRIPILKRAFSNQSNVKDDSVLLILMKPTIIIQKEAEAEAFPSLSSSSGD